MEVGKEKLRVSIHRVQKQNNGYDCGVFAIANMFEFVANRYKGLTERELNFAFLLGEMYTHLVKCLKQHHMISFQK